MPDNSYDLVQYHSFPYKQSHPNHLYTIAKLFGLDPTNIKRARVLELGCASGGNLIPMACNLPNSEFIGIDLSKKQIEQGQSVIKSLNLKNITLKTESILDFQDKKGSFDYIICHGVFSWVDQTVRDKIFDICKNALTESGVAFISYNALPGWNMVKSIRDMMKYHVQHFQDPLEKAQQARSILQFMLNGLVQQDTPYAKFLENELKLLANQHDSYLFHEHLEEVNDPIYFYKFVEQAQQHELAYLSDTDVAQMFPANLPANVAETFFKIQDIVRQGQYMDFFRNQRFRQTLLCHANAAIDRKIDFPKLKQFHFQFSGQIQGSKDSLTVDNAQMKFVGQYVTLSLERYLPKLAMQVLAEQSQPISFENWIKKIHKRAPSYKLEQIEKCLEVEVNLVRLVLGQVVLISSFIPSFISKPSVTPKISKLVDQQLKAQNYVTNQRHELVSLSQIEQQLLKLCQGQLHRENLSKALAESVVKNQIPLLREDGQPITNHDEIGKRVENLTDELLLKFANNALLTG